MRHMLAGVLWTIPLVAVLFVLLRLPALQAFHQFVIDTLGPMFAKVSTGQVLLISTLAGVGEEMAFRWVLQGGLGPVIGDVQALVVVSLVFGAVHWLNATYFVLATFMGLFLGWLYLEVGLLAAIVCHAIYDAIALLYLQRRHAER